MEPHSSSIPTLFSSECRESVAPTSRRVIRNLPSDRNKDILKRVHAVTVDEMKQVITDLILPCFKPGKSNVVVTCAKLMQEGTETAVNGTGYKVQSHELSHFHDDFGLTPDEDETEESSEVGDFDGSEESFELRG